MTHCMDIDDPTADSAPAPRDAAWHAQPVDEALHALGASRTGLGDDEATARLQRHGRNEIRSDPGPSALAVLARQLRSPLIYALLVSAAVAFAFSDVADGSVVLAVVVLNALIGFAQEYRAGKAIQALASAGRKPYRRFLFNDRKGDVE